MTDCFNLTEDERMLLTHAVLVAEGKSDDVHGENLPLDDEETNRAVHGLVDKRLMMVEPSGAGLCVTTWGREVAVLMADMAVVAHLETE